MELSTMWQEPEFRYQTVTPAARTPEHQDMIAKILLVGNSYEDLGVLIRGGLIDREMAINLFNANALAAWQKLCPVIAAVRRSTGAATWEHFEYLVVLAQDWVEAHPLGNYPSGMRRIVLTDELREADAHYAASRTQSTSTIRAASQRSQAP